MVRIPTAALLLLHEGMRRRFRRGDDGGISEAAVFLHHFKDLTDARQQAKVVYPLERCCCWHCGHVAGAETFADIARLVTRSSLLRRFRPFKEGMPPHDRMGESSPASMPNIPTLFVAWVASVTGVPEGVIAIDGKTCAGRAPNRQQGADPHGLRLRRPPTPGLGQVKVAEKSNEILAIPKLLSMLAIEGSIVTIDAMGCQRDIAQKVLDKKADYVLALKGNQGSLRDDVELFAAEQKARAFRHKPNPRQYGRWRSQPHRSPAITVIRDVDWLQERHHWPGLKGVVMVESGRETSGKTEHEGRFLHYLPGSRRGPVGPLVRGHWSVRTASTG